MTLRLPISPGARLRFEVSATLGPDGAESEVIILLDWREQLAAWWATVRPVSGPVAWSARVTPGAPLWPPEIAQRVGLPPGEVVAIGPDPYIRSDLGRDLRLAYLGPDDA